MKTTFEIVTVYFVLAAIALAGTTLAMGLLTLFNASPTQGDPAWFWWALPRFAVCVGLIPVFVLAGECLRTGK